MQEFLENPLYCPSPNQVRPKIKKMLIDIFDGGFFEALIIAGIGTGKSFLTSKAIEYITYRLLCLKNPQKYFNLADGSGIYIVNVSTNREQAKKVVFGEIKNRIDQNPWFQHFHKPSDEIRSELRFDKNVSVFPIGSNEAAPLGYNIFAGIIDEASFHVRTKTKDYAEASHNQMVKRIKSRFIDKGMMFIITSPRFVYDFAEKKFESDKSKRLYKKRLATWEAIPKEQFSGELFDLGDFFPEHKNRMIPKEYYDDFAKNPDLAMRDLGAIPSLAVQAYFKDSGVILRNANKKRVDPIKYPRTNKLADWFRAKDTEPRFIHLDLALGKETGDVAGFAMGKFDGWIDYTNKLTKRIERRPKIYIDLMHAFEAKPGKEIEFSEIRDFIYELKKRGFNIKKVSADSWQCLREGTKIPLLSGEEKEIQDLKRNDYVYSVKDNGKIVYGKVKAVWSSGKKEIFRVHLDNGKYIDCSDNHPFMMRKGNFVEVKDLKVGDSLMPLYRRISERKKNGFDGYEMIKQVNNKRGLLWEFTHRVVMREKKEIERGKVIHHKNGNKLNNNPDNLVSLSYKEHGKVHKEQAMKWIGYARECLEKNEEAKERRNSALSKLGKVMGIKNKEKLREATIKRWKNPENRKKMSEFIAKRNSIDNFRKGYVTPEETKEKIRKTIKNRWKNDKKFIEKMKNRDTANTCEKNGMFDKTISFSSLLPFRNKKLKDVCSLLSCSASKIRRRLRKEGVDTWKDFQKNNHKIVKIEKLNIKDNVWDIEIENHHNFAVSAGVFVHNSKDTLQILHNAGFQTMTVSMDKNIEGYNFLKEAILEDRINYYVHPIFIKECRYLELIEGKKVDHPQGFSKDIADSVAGVCWHCNKAVGGLGIVIAGGADGTRALDEHRINQ